MTTNNTSNEDALSELVNHELEMYQDEEALKQRKLKEDLEKQEQYMKQDLRHLVEEFLTEAFRDNVTMEYKTKVESGHLTTLAVFSYLQVDWTLQKGPHGWRIAIGEPGYYARTRAEYVNGRHLQSKLLLEMGKYRKECELRDTQEQYRKQQQQREEERQKKAEVEYERQRQERMAEAEAQHQRLTALLAKEQERAERGMWHWPEGTTIEIYKVQWQEGSHRDKDNDEGEEESRDSTVSFDYESGWTATSSLDDRGRITLEAKRSSSYSSRVRAGRTIQLSFGVHRPIWEVHTLSSIKDVPEVLTLSVEVSFPHVVERYNRDLERSMLVEVEGELEYEEEPASRVIGHVPLPWIQALADNAANGH